MDRARRPLARRDQHRRADRRPLVAAAAGSSVLPQAAGADAANPIDRFVLAKLAASGLAPTEAADRRTSLRRLSIDLTGLPPTPEELAAFLADTSAEAYERQVDRLLASPRYGERWARHWMDVVHFAETHGNDQDRPRPNAWPYRDYLIHSFNDDKPYAVCRRTSRWRCVVSRRTTSDGSARVPGRRARGTRARR